MRIATQKEALPNDIESLIRRLGQELSCSICLSVFEDPTMTPCNHTFCRECIERAVTLTKKGSSIPCNQCPVCKSKTPKRSLNPSAAAAKLCKIYEEIVRTYSEINGGNDDWINETGVRGNEASYYGGVPLDNLSQLYPYPEKPKLGNENDLLTEMEEEDDDDDVTTQLEGSSRIYDETTQLETDNFNLISKIPDTPSTTVPVISTISNSIPSSPLLTGCDRLIINTQELEKLAAINDSIDKELAELERKLATTREEAEDSGKDKGDIGDREDLRDIDTTRHNDENVNNTSNIDNTASTAKKVQVQARIIQSSSDRIVKAKPAKKKIKTDSSQNNDGTCDDPTFDPVSIPNTSAKNTPLTGITTTGVKDEKSQIQLAKFSDKFNLPILPDFQGTVSHVLVPTGPGLIVKKRTMKYFEAILLKKEIISFEWIDACLKAGKLLPCANYRVKGDEIGLKQGKRSSSDQKIFPNYKFYLYGEFSQPPRDQLENLIKAAGSSLLTDVQELSRGSVILADPSAQFTFEKDAQIIKKYPIVGTAWFLDSISCGRALEFHGYFIL